MKIERMRKRDVRHAIKSGTGLTGLARTYGCSTSKIYNRIAQIFHDPKTVMEKLWLVEKTNVGVIGTPDIVTDLALSMQKEPEVPTPQKEEIEGMSKELDVLKATEKELATHLLQCECDYQNALSYHTEQVALLEKKANELAAIELAFNRKVAEYQRLAKEDEVYVEVLRRSESLIGTAKQELDKTRSKIAILEKTTLCLFQDGRVAVFDGPEIELNEDGADAIFAKLTEESACENLRIREVKALATALAILGNAKPGTTLEIESQTITEAYEALAWKTTTL